MKQGPARANDARDDSGATLIWVAILSIVLFGMAAFAVDAGLGYTVKRKLSATADSAALAGAMEAVRTYSAGSCNTGAIEAAVQANHVANNPTSADLPVIGNGIEIDCAELSVTVTETSTLDSIFGRILGVETLRPGASATAKASGSSSASGMRPFTVCLWDALRSAEDAHASGAMQSVSFMLDNTPNGTGVNDPFTVQCQPTGAPGSGGWAFFDLQNSSAQTTADLIEFGYGGWPGSPTSFDVGDRQDYQGGPNGWGPATGPTVESAADRAATPGAIGRGDTGYNVKARDIRTQIYALVGESVLLPTAEYWTDDASNLWPNGKVYQGFGAVKARIQGAVIRNGASNQVSTAVNGNAKFTAACNLTRFALFAAGSGAPAGNAPETNCSDRAQTILASDRGIKFVLFWTYDGRWTASPFDSTSPCNPADITCGWRVSLTG